MAETTGQENDLCRSWARLHLSKGEGKKGVSETETWDISAVQIDSKSHFLDMVCKKNLWKLDITWKWGFRKWIQTNEIIVIHHHYLRKNSSKTKMADFFNNSWRFITIKSLWNIHSFADFLYSGFLHFYFLYHCVPFLCHHFSSTVRFKVWLICRAGAWQNAVLWWKS